jgi:hypothetical protein
MFISRIRLSVGRSDWLEWLDYVACVDVVRPGGASAEAAPHGQEGPGAASRGQEGPGAASRGQEGPGAASHGQEGPGAASHGARAAGRAKLPGEAGATEAGPLVPAPPSC